MLENYLSESVVGRARAKNIFTVTCHNIRDYTQDKHRRVDDTPYSERQGMLMQCEPIYNCYKSVTEGKAKPHVIYMSPQGKTLTQKRAKELSQLDSIFILCGHYEGVDQRIIDMIVDEEISLGDFVLTGGEIPAMAVVDAVSRMIPGVLASQSSYENESHFSGLLEYPQYTRPEEFMGRRIPDVLISGHHAKIEEWKRREAIRNTFNKRPDMLKNAELTDKEREFVKELENGV